MPNMPKMQTLNIGNPCAPSVSLVHCSCRFLVVDSEHGCEGSKATPVALSLRNQQTSWAALWAAQPT